MTSIPTIKGRNLLCLYTRTQLTKSRQSPDETDPRSQIHLTRSIQGRQFVFRGAGWGKDPRAIRTS